MYNTTSSSWYFNIEQAQYYNIIIPISSSSSLPQYLTITQHQSPRQQYRGMRHQSVMVNRQSSSSTISPHHFRSTPSIINVASSEQYRSGKSHHHQPAFSVNIITTTTAMAFTAR
jgi:hypothetical protein